MYIQRDKTYKHNQDLIFETTKTQMSKTVIANTENTKQRLKPLDVAEEENSQNLSIATLGF